MGFYPRLEQCTQGKRSTVWAFYNEHKLNRNVVETLEYFQWDEHFRKGILRFNGQETINDKHFDMRQMGQ